MSRMTLTLGNSIFGILIVLVLGIVASVHCAAADIVLLHTQVTDDTEERQIREVAEFYGLDVQSVDVSSPTAITRTLDDLRKPDTLAVLISGGALSRLEHQRIESALHRRYGAPLPVLIFGVNGGNASAELRTWSGGAIEQCSSVAPNHSPKLLQVGNVENITGTLSGLQLPAVAAPECGFRLSATVGLQTLLSIQNETHFEAGVLLRHRTATSDVFFLPSMKLFDSSWMGKRNSLPRAFSSLAPYFLFLSYAAGDFAWHSDGHYANLTVDDAWLTQPFGNLDYRAVLSEMEAHNFHTTVAFIPWNYDRSRPEVVELFRRNPARFSVCIHGNNHAHQEFGAYATNPLARQIEDIKQAVARMERFQALTSIAYDRFMVFPHAVAPEATFMALRTYGFSGTANLWNVPMDKAFPEDASFLMRPYTSAYGGLLSLSRYAAAGDVPRLEISIHSFLGNPLLFYGHEDLFEHGPNSFNAHADYVNRVAIGTRWTSLGEIARHCYLSRKRMDGNFDIRMFSSEMDLENTTAQDTEFYIQWNGDGASAITSVAVDGSPAVFQRPSPTDSLLHISIGGHQIRRIRVRYRNDLDLAREDIRRRDLYAYTLRTISDFRDLHLSRSSWGRKLTRDYYGQHRDQLELYLEQKWWLGLIFVGLIFGAIQYRRRRRKLVQRPTDALTLSDTDGRALTKARHSS